MSDTKNIEKFYVPVKEVKGTNCLKVELYYTTGGMDYFSGRSYRRGYYVSVSPMERKNKNGYTTETYTLGAGYKKLILEDSRQSKKAEKQASEMFLDEANILISAVLREYGLEQEF